MATERHELAVYINQARIGRVFARRETLHFEYEAVWRSDKSSFPLSYSLPLALETHSGAAVMNYLRGLLPDNEHLLRQWGRRFGVPPHSPIKMLAHVGQDCAGAVRFLPAEVGPEEAGSVDWLDEDGLCERIEDLVSGRGDGRLAGDEGQFSLAGAQYKTALVYDDDKDRWGVPKGREPTTFILKPAIEGIEHQVWNEHFCLRLARECGLAAAESRVLEICGHSLIVVQRYDRIRSGRSIARVHQEDMCQALAVQPDRKYENEGGPGVPDIMRVLDSSESSAEDHERFLRAVLFNVLIGGTDAHAKNYSILWDRGPSMRLAPLYDLNSILPYVRPRGHDYHWPRVRSSMRIGTHYVLAGLQPQHFEQMAERCAYPSTRLHHLLRDMAMQVAEATLHVSNRVRGEGAPARFVGQLRDGIEEHCTGWLKRFNVDQLRL